ncbi:hypothetical protein ATANTOWER_012313, partial [Ataeniobius toweri]|nr:hypothetical protein [Ataeniobius toweri]
YHTGWNATQIVKLQNSLFLRKKLQNSQVQRCQVTPPAEAYAKMECVKESIQKALPSLSSDLVESLMFRLEMIGVNCVDDLSFVKTEDLEGILPPIQCRRVIQAFCADSQVELTPTAEPLQQNNCQLQLSPASSGSMECSSSCESYVVPCHKMPPSLPSTPCILIMGEQLFKVAVDQVIVNDHIKSLTAALSYAFSMFYVLNIKYPKDMSLTLEFIQ